MRTRARTPHLFRSLAYYPMGVRTINLYYLPGRRRTFGGSTVGACGSPAGGAGAEACIGSTGSPRARSDRSLALIPAGVLARDLAHTLAPRLARIPAPAAPARVGRRRTHGRPLACVAIHDAGAWVACRLRSSSVDRGNGGYTPAHDGGAAGIRAGGRSARSGSVGHPGRVAEAFPPPGGARGVAGRRGTVAVPPCPPASVRFQRSLEAPFRRPFGAVVSALAAVGSALRGPVVDGRWA